MPDQPAAHPPQTADGRVCTTHSVVRFTVRRASPKCPSFRAGDCRDKAMVQFEVERLADETAEIGRSVVSTPKALS